MPRQPSFLPRQSSFLLWYEHDDVMIANIDILTKPKFAATLGFCLRRFCFETKKHPLTKRCVFVWKCHKLKDLLIDLLIYWFIGRPIPSQWLSSAMPAHKKWPPGICRIIPIIPISPTSPRKRCQEPTPRPHIHTCRGSGWRELNKLPQTSHTGGGNN